MGEGRVGVSRNFRPPSSILPARERRYAFGGYFLTNGEQIWNGSVLNNGLLIW
jgi:hypothetical protein